jgi:hypothetical protein
MTYSIIVRELRSLSGELVSQPADMNAADNRMRCDLA